MIYTSISHALMAFFAMFRTVFNNDIMESATDVFAQKNFPKDINLL